MVDTRRLDGGSGPEVVGTPEDGARRTNGPRTVFSLSEEETFELGRRTARTLQGGEMIVLEGDLGLGKTVFVRGIAVGLGVPEDEVSSPSFALVQEYRGGRLPLFHADLYRLDDEDDARTLGLEDLVTAGAVVVVEWGEKLPPYVRRGAVVVRLHDIGEDSRRIEIVPRNAPGRRRGDA